MKRLQILSAGACSLLFVAAIALAGLRPVTAPPTTLQPPANVALATAAASPNPTMLPNYVIDWYSVNGGGSVDASSASWKMGMSAAQSVAGEASSASYRIGFGFWYGGTCPCHSQGDLDGSGFIDVQDVLKVIQIAFVNGADIQDPGCPKTRGDVNNDGVVDVNDVLYIIKTAFTNGPNPVDPCGL